MSTFKRILESKSEISQKDMKRLQRAAAAETPEQAKEILKNLESTQERSSRKTRTVPSAKPSTVEQTPLNKYIRGEAEKGRGVSQELRDTAGIDDAERRGYIKPEKVGETKPTSGATNRARARGAAARQGVDISTPESKLNPRGQKFAEFPGASKVRVIKPSKPAPPPTKTQVVKQSDVSKKASEFREKVKRANKRGALSKQVDPILKDLKIQGQRQRELQKRMSAGYDRIITRRGEDLLKQIRADAPSRGREAMMTAQRNRAAKLTKVAQLKPSKVTGGTPRVTDRVGSTPAPTKPTPTPTKPTPTPTKPTLTAAQQKKVTQRILKSAKPQLGKRLQTKTVPNLAGKVTTQASKVKPKVTAGGVLGRGVGALGAAFDVAQGREDAKKAGAGKTRSWLRGAARAAGGLLGATAGGLAGGGFGSFALGTAGYMAGSNLADKAFTSLAGATKGQKDWMKKANLASQKGTAVDKVKYRKGNKAVIYDPRVGKERIGTFDPTSGKFKAANLATSKAYTAKNPFERLGRQFSRSNEGSGLFGLNIVKGGALADMAKKYYADKDEKARAQRVSDFKKAASTK
jgi:hypothetical protein